MIDSLKRIWNFNKKRRTTLSLALFLSFLRSSITITEFFSIMVAVQVLCKELDVKTGIQYIVILALICILGNYITSYFEQALTLESGLNMIADKRIEIGNRLKKFPLGFFKEDISGRIISTLTTTLSGVELAATMAVIGIVSGLFSSLCLFLFMLFYEWKLGILTGIGMLLYLLLVGYQMQLSRKNAPFLQDAQLKLSQQALTFLQGIKVTKAFHFTSSDAPLKEAIKDSCDANISLTKKSMPTQYAASISIAIFESILLLYAVYICFSTTSQPITKTLILILFSFFAYMSLNQAGSMLSMIGLLDVGLIEAEEITKTPIMEEEKPLKHSISEEIEFKDVSFSYENNEVLHHISAKIPSKSLTAIIGPSGSGKTTLCQLIPRFYDIKEGEITIGGVNIKNLSSEELMKKISIVFQDVYLFEDTIFNNISFGKPNATLKEVRAAAQDANCDEFIMSLKDGYDTILMEGGCSLSGGEKQRISIARAILKDAPIIILDEATSALDADNEHEILSAIDKLTENKTVIMIAHRLKTVEKADKIIALKDGTIVQEGTHMQLKEQEGLYRNFLLQRKKASQWKLNH